MGEEGRVEERSYSRRISPLRDKLRGTGVEEVQREGRGGEVAKSYASLSRGWGGEGVCFAVMFMGCLSMRPERHQGQVLHSARRQARSRASEQPWAMASDVPDVLRGSGPWDAFVCRFHDLLAAAQWAPFAAVTEGALGSHRDALPHPALF